MVCCALSITASRSPSFAQALVGAPGGVGHRLADAVAEAVEALGQPADDVR